MSMPYESYHGPVAVAQEKFEKHVVEGLDFYPGAIPSHFGFDCETTDDLNTMKEYAKNWGQISSKQTEDKEIVLVKLDSPLKFGKHTLPYLELIGPDKDISKKRPTGPRVLVFQVNHVTLDEADKIPSPKDPAVILRFQNKSAAQLSGLGL